jgi:hypothetical protein
VGATARLGNIQTTARTGAGQTLQSLPRQFLLICYSRTHIVRHQFIPSFHLRAGRWEMPAWSLAKRTIRRSARTLNQRRRHSCCYSLLVRLRLLDHHCCCRHWPIVLVTVSHLFGHLARHPMVRMHRWQRWRTIFEIIRLRNVVTSCRTGTPTQRLVRCHVMRDHQPLHLITCGSPQC